MFFISKDLKSTEKKSLTLVFHHDVVPALPEFPAAAYINIYHESYCGVMVSTGHVHHIFGAIQGMLVT